MKILKRFIENGKYAWHIVDVDGTEKPKPTCPSCERKGRGRDKSQCNAPDTDKQEETASTS